MPPRPRSGKHTLTTSQRGYGPEHQAERRRRIDAAGPDTLCWRCRRPLGPNYRQADLGHDDHDRTTYRGLEHPACNRGAAARATNTKRRHRAGRRTPRPTIPRTVPRATGSTQSW